MNREISQYINDYVLPAAGDIDSFADGQEFAQSMMQIATENDWGELRCTEADLVAFWEERTED